MVSDTLSLIDRRVNEFYIGFTHLEFGYLMGLLIEDKYLSSPISEYRAWQIPMELMRMGFEICDQTEKDNGIMYRVRRRYPYVAEDKSG